MRLEIFNACLLAGWFMLTMGGIMLNPGTGLIIGGVALVVLTLFVAMRVGLRGAPQKETATADKAA